MGDLEPLSGLIGAERAMKTAELGFPAGGFRWCKRDEKFMKVTTGQIAEWLVSGVPRCRICGERTALLTPEERDRMES